ncbi:uncharacterized protein V1510DRAFT_417165 [Dipodascopsis tothii]|uniref:uncharacterized protein n=1 Tax=Dipodascopsis tothii TaxID=44089 RepID=UPI0034CF6D2B
MASILAPATVSGTLSPADTREIESILGRIAAKHSVRGVLVLDRASGAVLRSTLAPPQSPSKTAVDDDLTRRYARSCVQLVSASATIASDLFADDEVRLLRLRTRDHELLVVPDTRFILAVVQDMA